MSFASKAALWALAATVVLGGCKATAPVRSGPDSILFAPEYPTLKLESLCYLGTATMTPDPIAVQTTDALLRSYLTGGQQKFIVIDEAACRARARREGVEDQLDKLIRVWKDSRTVDRFVLSEVGRKVGVHGVIFGDLLTWRAEQVDWQSEGASFTEVAITLSIFDAASGILAWKGEKMERRESVHYRPGQGIGAGVYQQGGGVERTDRADRVAPKPPNPEIVAESVVQVLVEGLPDQPKPAN